MLRAGSLRRAGVVLAALVSGCLLSACKIDKSTLALNADACGAAAQDGGSMTECPALQQAQAAPGGTDLALSATAPGQPPSTDSGGAAGAQPADAVAGKRMRQGLVVPPHLRSVDATGSLPPGSAAPTAMPPGPKTGRPAARQGGAPTRLADAVATAVLTYPEIRINQSRVREASAGIGIAESALYPSLDVRFAKGLNFSGTYEGNTVPYKNASNDVDGRFDGGLILRQLLYDFGATRADIERARLVRDAEKLKLQEKVEDIAHRTSQTYLKIIEQRALVALVDETIAAHEQLARIVQAHNQEGHGTLADVQRVNSRLVDVRAIRSDVSLQLLAAEDQMARLTRQAPGRLAAVPDYRKAIPKSPQSAIERVIARNPRLASLQATRQSNQKELESHDASILPRINLEVDGESKNYRNGPAGRTQAEGRAMLAMRFRLMDGGLSNATREQIGARIASADFTLLNEREQMEADIRQGYRALDSAGRKMKLVGEGVESSRKVRELYLEQFKGGKRTIFELLDGQMSYYSIRRTQIENQFEGRRAIFDILKATGDLTATLSARD